VVLRDLGSADVEPFVRAFVADPPLASALGEDDDPDADEVRGMLASEDARRADGQRLQLAIADAATDAFLGNVVMHSFDWRHRRGDVGFFVVPDARRRGVALEALRLLTAWAFAALELQRIGLTTTPDNVATQRLAERAGFRREGVLRAYTFERGAPVDNVVFSLLPDEVPG
jgi:RimJ/RimL family protein N-acetyltransferase